MPYIQQEAREVYVPLNDVVEAILSEKDWYERIELTSYYVQLLLGLTKVARTDGAWRSVYQNVLIIKNLIKNRWRRTQFLDMAGDYNYLISGVLFPLVDDGAKYGARALLHVAIWEVMDNIPKSSGTKTFNRMAKAVLLDVIAELYRRKTAAYEDKKIEENGDI